MRKIVFCNALECLPYGREIDVVVGTVGVSWALIVSEEGDVGVRRRPGGTPRLPSSATLRAPIGDTQTWNAGEFGGIVRNQQRAQT